MTTCKALENCKPHLVVTVPFFDLGYVAFTANKHLKSKISLN